MGGLNIKQYAAFYALDLLTREQIVSFAEKLLIEGYSSRQLNMVAAEDTSDKVNPLNKVEFRRKMDRVLAEFKFVLPEQLEALQVIFCYWCKEIVDRKIRPYEGAFTIYSILISQGRHQQECAFARITGSEDLYFYGYYYDEILIDHCPPIDGYQEEMQNNPSFNRADASIMVSCKEYLRKYQAV